jgi:hypothetical protein
MTRRFLLRAINLTARNRPILEERTNHQLVKRFPAFYRNHNFITVYTKAKNSPYCASAESSQYTTMLLLYDPFYYYVLSRTRFENCLFISGSFTKTFYACLLSHACHMSSNLDFIGVTNTRR